MLVSDVIEETQETILTAGSVNLPAWDVLEGGIDDSVKTLTVEERQDRIPRDGTLEFDDASMEVVLIKDNANYPDIDLQQRGWLRSTAAIHADGVRLILDNPWHRITVFNALKSVISQLYGYGLYVKTTATDLAFSTVGPVVLPATARDTLSSVWVKHGPRWQQLRRGIEFEVLHDATPKELQFWSGGIQGAEMRVSYKTDFTQPADVTDDLLDDCGVPETLQPYLSLGVAGYLLQGKEVPRVQAEHIAKLLESQAIPIGSLTSVGRSLIDAFQRYVSMERTRQAESAPPVLEFG